MKKIFVISIISILFFSSCYKKSTICKEPCCNINKNTLIEDYFVHPIGTKWVYNISNTIYDTITITAIDTIIKSGIKIYNLSYYSTYKGNYTSTTYFTCEESLDYQIFSISYLFSFNNQNDANKIDSMMVNDVMYYNILVYDYYIPKYPPIYYNYYAKGVGFIKETSFSQNNTYTLKELLEFIPVTKQKN